jgi:hypothetical protein
MSSQIPGTGMRAAYGLRVDRAAANLPATTSGNLFSVSGRILLTTIVGVVTTVIQAQANAVKLEAFLTSAAAATDMCATVDSNGQAVGKMLGITGTPSAAGIFGFAVPQNNEFIINGPGFIRLNTAATNTGQMSWSVTYIPLDSGATVAAV